MMNKIRFGIKLEIVLLGFLGKCQGCPNCGSWDQNYFINFLFIINLKIFLNFFIGKGWNYWKNTELRSKGPQKLDDPDLGFTNNWSFYFHKKH
jgi:hypothetical protein